MIRKNVEFAEALSRAVLNAGSSPKASSPGHSVFAVTALTSTCHIKGLAYFGSHRTLHQNEISRV